MMLEMPRPRPPHLHREVTRHGRVVWFVRVGKGPRTRIRSTYGTPDFKAEYDNIIGGKPRIQAPTEFNAKTLGWLIERYRESSAWGSKLSGATRRQREGILQAICKSAGNDPISHIDQAAIDRGIDRRADRPHAARHFLQTVRCLFQWAVKAKHADRDPTAGMKTIRPKTEGHHVWTEEECERFEARWKLGTRERLAFDVLLYTGLRRGDAVRLGRPHVKNGIATIRTEKRKPGTPGIIVTLPILPPLQASITAGPIGELTFIATMSGRPRTKESFGMWFKIACRAAGVPGTAHGLRKCGATRAANNGASDAQLEAMFGWARGSKEAAEYTRQADRARLATKAATTLLLEAHISPRSM